MSWHFLAWSRPASAPAFATSAAQTAGLPGRYVRLTVIETGHGMEAATPDRITEPFFTARFQGEDTGLGLSMARGFAEQSGVGVHIDDAAGAYCVGTPFSQSAQCVAISCTTGSPARYRLVNAGTKPPSA